MGYKSASVTEMLDTFISYNVQRGRDQSYEEDRERERELFQVADPLDYRSI